MRHSIGICDKSAWLKQFNYLKYIYLIPSHLPAEMATLYIPDMHVPADWTSIYIESSLISQVKTAAGSEIRFCQQQSLQIFVAIDELDDALVH